MDNRISPELLELRQKAGFPEEEKKLYRKYKARRAVGLVVDYEYMKTQMKILVKESGKDKDGKFKGSNKWLSGFTKRKGVSMQIKTNKKSKSIKERLPKVKNFHYWSIYRMALEEP